MIGSSKKGLKNRAFWKWRLAVATWSQQSELEQKQMLISELNRQQAATTKLEEEAKVGRSVRGDSASSGCVLKFEV